MSHFPGHCPIRVILSLTCNPKNKKGTWHKTYPQLFSIFIPNLNPVNLNSNEYRHYKINCVILNSGILCSKFRRVLQLHKTLSPGTGETVLIFFLLSAQS